VLDPFRLKYRDHTGVLPHCAEVMGDEDRIEDQDWPCRKLQVCNILGA